MALIYLSLPQLRQCTVLIFIYEETAVNKEEMSQLTFDMK